MITKEKIIDRFIGILIAGAVFGAFHIWLAPVDDLFSFALGIIFVLFAGTIAEKLKRQREKKKIKTR